MSASSNVQPNGREITFATSTIQLHLNKQIILSTWLSRICKILPVGPMVAWIGKALDSEMTETAGRISAIAMVTLFSGLSAYVIHNDRKLRNVLLKKAELISLEKEKIQSELLDLQKQKLVLTEKELQLKLMEIARLNEQLERQEKRCKKCEKLVKELFENVSL